MPWRKIVLGVVILAAAVVWLDLWLDERWVRQFMEREQMTVRPVSRYRPQPATPDWAR